MQLSQIELAELLQLALKAYNDISSLSVTPEEFEDFDENKARVREIARKAGFTEDQIRRA